MAIDDAAMHEHFFYVMDNFEKLADKVDELEQNLAVVIHMLLLLTKEYDNDE